MHWGWWLYVIAIAFAPATLIVGRKWSKAAIHIRRTHVLKGPREWEPTTAEHLSPEMIEFVRDAVEGFRRIGFEVVLNARQREGATGVLDAHRLLFVNRTTNDLVLAVVIRTKTTRYMSVAITSRFVDQRRIVTSSRQDVGFLPKDPLTDWANFPQATEPPLLWAAHLKRLERAGLSGQPRIAPAPGEEEAHLRAIEEREGKRRVACGYYLLLPSGDYRLTWKGAVLATCKTMELIRRWRTRRARWKSDRLWRELGMDSSPTLNAIDHAGSIALAPCKTGQPTAGQVSAAPPAHLPYGAVLRPGEIRQSSDAAGLTVRIGLPSIGQLLASRWPWLLYLAFVLCMLGATVLRLWIWVKLSIMLGPAFASGSPVIMPFLCFWAFLFIWELWNLWRALSQARGTVVLVTNEEGLRFVNAIGRPHSGLLPRRSFHSFRIAVDGSGVPPRMYRIDLRSNDGRRPIRVALGRDLAAMRTLVHAIHGALGLNAGSQPLESAVEAPV